MNSRQLQGTDYDFYPFIIYYFSEPVNNNQYGVIGFIFQFVDTANPVAKSMHMFFHWCVDNCNHLMSL